MAVTQRLRELRAEGKHQLADTLAVEALRNETPSVTVDGDHVHVETATFVGEHALSGPFDDTDEPSIRAALARSGTYALAGDESGRTFRTGSLYDRIVDALTVAPESRVPTDDVPTRARDAAGQTTATVGTDGDVEPTAPVETARTPSSVIRQAVAAVQSQFRE